MRTIVPNADDPASGDRPVNPLHEALTLVKPFPFVTPPMQTFDRETLTTTTRILADELGAEGVVELLQSYLADTAPRLDELAGLVSAADQPTLKRAAHSLKGSSSIFGLVALEKAALRLEHSAAQGATAQQGDMVAELRHEFALARPHLEQVLAEMSATA
jgi:HPt (histidine-containing phosphotransfer) domain-containing protein